MDSIQYSTVLYNNNKKIIYFAQKYQENTALGVVEH